MKALPKVHLCLSLSICASLMTLCQSQLPVGNSMAVLDGLLQASPSLELSGLFHVDTSRLRQPGMVSVNTTFTAAPEQISLLDLAVTTAKTAVFVLPDITVLVQGLHVVGASQVMSEPGVGEYTVWFPFFALLPQAYLALQDLTVYLNPTTARVRSRLMIAWQGRLAQQQWWCPYAGIVCAGIVWHDQHDSSRLR